MQTQFGTVSGDGAFGAHHKWFITSVAKFILALGASEMHAATSKKRGKKLVLKLESCIE